MGGLKPGYKTTELAVTVLLIVGETIAALTSNLAPHWAAIGASVAGGVYALSRGLAKLNPPKDAGTPPPS